MIKNKKGNVSYTASKRFLHSEVALLKVCGEGKQATSFDLAANAKASWFANTEVPNTVSCND